MAAENTDDPCLCSFCTGSTADHVWDPDPGSSSCGNLFCVLNLNVEYEYLFADGGFSVDSILGKAKRKKKFDCDKEEVQLIAPADSYVLKDYENRG